MEFINEIGKKISQTGQKAVKKTKDMADVAKLNSAISGEEKKINETYFQIGQLYFSKYRENAENDFKVLVEQVSHSLSEIEKLKQQIQHVKGIKRCDNCGAEISDNSAFCSGCGAKVPQLEATNISDFIKCGNCGNLIKKELKFCTYCGSAVKDNTFNLKRMTCTCCGAKLHKEDEFCTECGTKILISEEE